MISHSNMTFPITILDVTWRLPFFQWSFTLWIVVILCLFSLQHIGGTQILREEYLRKTRMMHLKCRDCIFVCVCASLWEPRESDKVMHDGRVHKLFASEIKYKADRLKEKQGTKFSKCFFVCDSCWDIASLRNRFAHRRVGWYKCSLLVLCTISCQLCQLPHDVCASVVVTHLS